MWHKTKLPEFHLSIQQEAWRQRLNKETGQTKDAVQKRIDELQDQLNQKNSYLNNFRTEEAVNTSAQAQAHAENNPRAFDSVFDDSDDKMVGKNKPKHKQ